MIGIINRILKFFGIRVVLTTQRRLLEMAGVLSLSTKTLADAVASSGGNLKTRLEVEMENQALKLLEDQVKKTVEVQASAVALLGGVSDRIAAAVAKALENGATAEQLAPITQEVADLKASTDALAAAVASVPQ